ncbi:hypothetical protein BDN72DRAFT_612293 [Pluteus cervinus]|uniref:Uncharacterized protein n=1 Tax=Pluteus cervinus TaxID=181527 RepID=A0ACD3AUR9_9AGAR|nr:hypothetical protein BDN72DRAFT_612293 [Pluteus cervinus]
MTFKYHLLFDTLPWPKGLQLPPHSPLSIHAITTPNKMLSRNRSRRHDFLSLHKCGANHQLSQYTLPSSSKTIRMRQDPSRPKSSAPPLLWFDVSFRRWNRGIGQVVVSYHFGSKTGRTSLRTLQLLPTPAPKTSMPPNHRLHYLTHAVRPIV